MLTISQVTKSFGGRTLFKDASLQVNRRDRIGLVGPNGAGKSTLFSLILSDGSPDEGRLSFERGATLGFLPQESAPAGEETVLELATAITPALVAARDVIKRHDAGEHIDDATYHDAMHTFDELGGWQLARPATAIRNGARRGRHVLAPEHFRKRSAPVPATAGRSGSDQRGRS